MEGSKIRENEGRKEVEGSDAEEENEEALKNIIASHPSYEVLIDPHVKCLKVGLGEAGEFDITNNAGKKLVNSKSRATTSLNSSELDHFMEAYCMALSKLKEAIEEAIEEPTKETKAFLNATYIQLKELNEPNNPQQPLISSKSLDDALSR